MVQREHHQRYWFSVAAACGALCVAMIATESTLASSTSNFAFTGHFMIIAYVAAFASVACFVAGIRMLPFPLAVRGEAPQGTEPAAVEAPQPLRVHYTESPPYRRPGGKPGFHTTEHHVGITNPAGNPEVTGVRVEWTAISPQPRVANLDRLPGIPCAVPRDTGGDAAIGIDLPAGRQELWAPISTWIAPDGWMVVREFPSGYPTTRGDPTGFPYGLQPGDRLRFTYRIVADNLPHATFSLVVAAADGHIQCDLEDA